jgi:hypothetical protein
MSDAVEVRKVRAVGRKEVWGSGKCPYSVVDFFLLNNRQGGEIVQLVLDNGKLKPPDIYGLLQESSSDLCKPFVPLLVVLGH